MTQATLFRLLENSLKYTPLVHRQVNSFASSTTTQEFVVDYSGEEIPEDSLLFFLPTLNSLDTNKLVVRIPLTHTDSTQYQNIVCDIYIESNDGTPSLAKQGDIVAYRMCIFRFIKFSSTSYRAILINSPLQNDIKCSNIYSTNATFASVPKIKNSEQDTILVTKSEFERLLNRVERLEERISYGTEEPEVALAGKDVGSIYIKLED